jgi:hypothetical protein
MAMTVLSIRIPAGSTRRCGTFGPNACNGGVLLLTHRPRCGSTTSISTPDSNPAVVAALNPATTPGRADSPRCRRHNTAAITANPRPSTVGALLPGMSGCIRHSSPHNPNAAAPKTSPVAAAGHTADHRRLVTATTASRCTASSTVHTTGTSGSTLFTCASARMVAIPPITSTTTTATPATRASRALGPPAGPRNTESRARTVTAVSTNTIA